MNGHIPNRHCIKNKISPRVNYMFLRLLPNARRGNARWLVSCSFQWRAHDGGCRLEDKSDARERAGVSPGCRWILEWKSGRGEKKWKKEREREWNSLRLRGFLIIAIVPQWVPTMADTTTIFFVATWKRKSSLPPSSARYRLPPPRPFHPPPPSLARSSGHISLWWLNVTETRLQSVNITSSVPVSPCFQRSFVDTASSWHQIERFRESIPRSRNQV